MPTSASPARILLAKIGLDGHDRGVKVLARSFRDAGFEVIYTGLWQTAESTMQAALQEDVDVVGVSLLSAAHMTVMPEVLRIGRELGIGGIPIVLGGIVPEADYPKLKEMGIAAVFNPGSPIDKILETMRELAGARPAPEARSLRDGYEKGEVGALARLITLISREQNNRKWQPSRGKTKVVGITGAPGVGKSSLIGKLGRLLRERGKRVAVLAIDPSSPITGGALLGDRLRMMAGPPDPDLFIRSISSRGQAGGLAPHAREVVDAIGGFGFEVTLVETVGAGQADVAVRELCDQTLLVLMPGSGDAMQFLKAGIIEIAHGFVLNKCDLAGADATEAQLRSALDDDRPIWKVSAVRNEGIDAVADWVIAR